jgi:hypothetical protein
MSIRKIIPCATLLLALFSHSVLAQEASYKFDFGPGKVAPGFTQILPADVYNKEKGYGFDFDSKVVGRDHGGQQALTADGVSSQLPFYFSVAVPEGNYKVTVNL